jgi:hypothetical protein
LPRRTESGRHQPDGDDRQNLRSTEGGGALDLSVELGAVVQILGVPPSSCFRSSGASAREVADPTAAKRFYTTVFGSDNLVRLQASEAPTTGFRGFTMSLGMSQPADVNALIDTALDAGATSVKPGAKSLWGYGGVVQADGTIWTVASSAKKDTGPATRHRRHRAPAGNRRRGREQAVLR